MFTLVLDLDGTLVWSNDVKNEPPPPGQHFIQYTDDEEKFREQFMGIRPGVPAFLEALAPWATLYVCTAASLGYAKAVLAILDPLGTYFGDRIVHSTGVHKTIHDFPGPRAIAVDDNFHWWVTPESVIPIVPYFTPETDYPAKSIEWSTRYHRFSLETTQRWLLAYAREPTDDVPTWLHARKGHIFDGLRLFVNRPLSFMGPTAMMTWAKDAGMELVDTASEATVIVSNANHRFDEWPVDTPVVSSEWLWSSWSIYERQPFWPFSVPRD